MTTNTIIKNCWSTIHQKDEKLLNVDYQPLSHIDQYLSFFDLSPFPTLKVKTDLLSDICSVEPSFKDLTDDVILSLRHHIYTQTKLDIVDRWAEKLMRFCEVRYPTLKNRSINKCKTKAAAQLHILHLATFFMDQSISTKDLRFLNIVLKLADLKWVLNKKKLCSGLNGKDSEIGLALFQFRIVLTTEYAINQLCEDEIK